MKKLMIAVAAVALATCAQAYSVGWGLANVGDSSLQDWDGNEIVDGTAGVKAYLYALSGVDAAITYKDNALLISATDASLVDSSAWVEDMNGWGNATGDPIDSTVKNLGAEFQNFQMILTDAADLSNLQEGDHVYVMTAQEIQGEDPTVGGSNWSYTYVDLETSIAKGGWNTVAAPEPTSGLLLLIGVAGLALKRRRA